MARLVERAAFSGSTTVALTIGKTLLGRPPFGRPQYRHSMSNFLMTMLCICALSRERSCTKCEQQVREVILNRASDGAGYQLCASIIASMFGKDRSLAQPRRECHEAPLQRRAWLSPPPLGAQPRYSATPCSQPTPT